MGIIDKLKNIFTEEVEEDDEIKVEQIKKEVRSVPIESPSVTKKEKEAVKEEIIEQPEAEVELPDAEEKQKPPVFFTDRDFEDLIAPKKRAEKHEPKEEPAIVEEKKKEEIPKPYGGNYSSTTIVKREKQVFKPTPIISPVYGVLDKNYHKEDIIDKNEAEYYSSADGLSVDSIRNKAYGTLENDLEDAIAAKLVSLPPTDDESMDLFDELEAIETVELPKKVVKPEKNVQQIEGVTIDLTKELDNLLMKREHDNSEEEELEKVEKSSRGKTKKEQELTESELFNLIDSMYEEGEEQ